MTTQRKIAPLDDSELIDPAYLGTGTPDGTKFLRDDQTYAVPSAGSGAPDDADYLVGTANGGLSNEIPVGTTPQGELGGTWGSPTVDATHSGSTHAGAAAAAVSTHEAAGDPHPGYATDGDLSTHAAAADPHTGYQKESEKDAANGYAGLNASSIVPIAHLASGTPDGTKFVRDDNTLGVPSGSGAPSDVDYLVGTASGGLSAEIVVGPTPGGELSGTWPSPTVDATHAGSTHKDPTVDVQPFSSAGNGTWTKPAGALEVLVILVGAGGAGGSGRKGNASSTRMGGGGGGGGGVTIGRFKASDLGSSEKYTVGDGVAGPGGQSSNSADGTAGTGGGDSFFGNSSAGVGTDAKLVAGGGAGGAAGDATGVAATWTGPKGWPYRGTGGIGGAVGGGGSFTPSAVAPGPNGGDGGGAGGGACGGCVTATNTAGAGGNGGLSGGLGAYTRAAGSAATSGTAGGTGAAPPTVGGIAGNGGGGGGASITGGTNGADGGPGGAPGGGGGGGGAALSSTNNSGAGGAGADGLVLIISWCVN